MKKVKYKNTEGGEVYFDGSPPYILSDTINFGAIENILTTEKVYGQDGAVLIDEKLDTRPLEIEGTIGRDDASEIANDRRELIRVFNPKLAGTLTYEYFDKTYSIDVRVVVAPEFQKHPNPAIQPFNILLEALDPYWLDTSFYDALIPLSTKENAFKFPLRITDDFVFARFISGEIIEVNNNGDVEVGAEFRLKTHGEVTNPRIYNVITQEYFGFEGTYAAGTEFTINTKRGQKKVTKTVDGDTTNAMGERMQGSSFLTLRKGTNYLQMQADTTVNAVFGEFNFTPLVMGV